MKHTANLLVRILLIVAVAALSGCTGALGYWRAEDAPRHFVEHRPDGRLCLTQAVGPKIGALFDQVTIAPRQTSEMLELRKSLLRSLRPLDIVLGRSHSASSREFLPTYFTHSMIWIGDEPQLRQARLWTAPEIVPLRESIKQSGVIAEAANTDVRVSPINVLDYYDEVVILRPTNRQRGDLRRALSRITARLGVPFDVSFDYEDKSRLSCIEFVVAVFPQLKLPERYAQGRLAIVPDDAVRGAIDGTLPLQVVTHLAISDVGKVTRLPVGETSRRLTQPNEKPAYPIY